MTFSESNIWPFNVALDKNEIRKPTDEGLSMLIFELLTSCFLAKLHPARQFIRHQF